MFRLPILVIGASFAGLSAESPTVYVGDKYEHRVQAIATDASGNTYATGSRVFRYPPSAASPLPTQSTDVFVTKLDATNTPVWIQYFSGKGTEYGTAVTTDRNGDVFAAGYTTSPNFPLRNPLQSDPAGAFILELAPDASRVLWSTYFGVAGTRITSIASAPDGTLVLGGYIVTDSFLDTRAFVSKIDVTADKLLWEQQFGGSQLACSGGSSCFLSARNNTATIVLDAAGNIYAAGNTNTTDFPVMPGAFLAQGYGPYIRKLSPAGTVLWSTYLTNNRVGMEYPVYPADTLSAIAAAADGSVVFTGGGSPNWPTTPGAYKTSYEGPAWPPFGPAGPLNPYVAKMNAAGTALVYSTFLGHNGTVPAAIAVDAKGDAWVNGPGDYITAVNPAGSALVFGNSYAQGSRGAAMAIDAGSLIHVAGAPGLVTILDGASSASGLSGVANAAGVSVTGRVVPGELFSIYGWSLGDQVFVDELSAPILYQSATQVNAVIPFATAGRDRVTIAVRRNGMDTAKAVVAITEASPEIFKLPSGQAAALNEDGTVNSAENPASAGSIVSVWGTGAPGWPAGASDGSINPGSPLVYLGVGASAGYQPFTQVTFAGAAPGLVAGVFQINLRLPASIGPGPNTVDIYALSMNEASAPAFVYVAP